MPAQAVCWGQQEEVLPLPSGREPALQAVQVVQAASLPIDGWREERAAARQQEEHQQE